MIKVGIIGAMLGAVEIPMETKAAKTKKMTTETTKDTSHQSHHSSSCNRFYCIKAIV